MLLPGQRRRRASRRRTSRVASFACELLRERCWAAAARVRRRLETRAHSYLASLLHAMQKRLQASYEAGAGRVPLKLATAARQQRGRSSIQWRVSLLGLDAAVCRQLPARSMPRQGDAPRRKTRFLPEACTGVLGRAFTRVIVRVVPTGSTGQPFWAALPKRLGSTSRRATLGRGIQTTRSSADSSDDVVKNGSGSERGSPQYIYLGTGWSCGARRRTD